MKLITLLLAALLSGCGLIQREPSPDTRIVLYPGQYMEFSRVSRRNAQGQSLDEYRCPSRQIMLCKDSGVRLECTCSVEVRL